MGLPPSGFVSRQILYFEAVILFQNSGKTIRAKSAAKAGLLLVKEMNNKPLVSVIMIFLNAEKFMEEAIESVLAQGYSNWELCLVDDGSCDSSTSLARHYARLYPEKVCYLEHDEHQNRGTGPSRNLGIQAASGEYVTFLDADDVWLPHKLEQQ